ncbi:MAG TPA: hypothetical protein VE959_14690 [Bryobacteraceae bacterium]|nr:hypothetical protein [Bryobacteraceae bacterium]
MNTELIGELIKLRYKLMWARTRTRNGKIAMFFVGYILLVFFIAIFSMGGIGAGIVAVRTGKAHTLAAGVLGVLYFQALLATVLMGFGINAVFADVELRRYPIAAVDRRIARHFLGLADPFWFLVLALELGLVVGLYAVGPGSIWLGLIAVLLLFVSNYVMAEVVALAVERLVRMKGGSAILLLCIMCLGIIPALAGAGMKKHPQLMAPLLRVLHYTPPYGAASAILRPGVEALFGLAVIVCWLVGLSAILVALERHPPQAHAAQSGALAWQGPCERLGALFGPANAPLVAQWLRFYSRNNRFRTAYPLALPLVAFLTFTQAQVAGPNAQFANILGCFAMIGFIGTVQFAVNQFGYMGGGFRRYFLLPTDPAALLRTGSYTFLMLSAVLIPVATIALALFSPVKLDARMLAMLVGAAVAALFVMHGVALWATLLGPRRGNFKASFGNDLSLAGNVVFIGGLLTFLFVPRVLAHVWPAAVAPGAWWVVVPLAPLAAVFYFVSLRNACGVFRSRREQILGVIEGRA